MRYFFLWARWLWTWTILAFDCTICSREFMLLFLSILLLIFLCTLSLFFCGQENLIWNALGLLSKALRCTRNLKQGLHILLEDNSRTLLSLNFIGFLLLSHSLIFQQEVWEALVFYPLNSLSRSEQHIISIFQGRIYWSILQDLCKQYTWGHLWWNCL